MFKSLLSVSGFTLLSRLTGFIRDIFITAILGQNDLSDAYNVATRLPNQFRAIFGEGAFNAAFTPAYSRVLEQGGKRAASQFSAQIFTLLLVSQIIMLVLAWALMPQFTYLLASGYADEPAKFALTVGLSRITFPYLLCMTLVTYYSALLNVHKHFAIAAFAPVLMNIAIVGFLLVARFFPNAAYAACWGVAMSGAAQLALLALAAKRLKLLERIQSPHFTGNVRDFFKALGPAIIGSAGVQLAILADTQMASWLGSGALSSVSNADRIYQLPIGVIGIAAGTVLLPQMSRLRAAGNISGALEAQNRIIALTLVLSLPFSIAFLAIPDLILRGAFMRGKFDAAAAHASSQVLAAYAFGLLAVLLIRSVVASFQSVGDTKTPMMVSLLALSINILLKFILAPTMGVSGLALATACGAWINVGLLVYLAQQRGLMRLDATLIDTGLAAGLAALALDIVVSFGTRPLIFVVSHITRFDNEVSLVLAGLIGACVYGAVFLGCARILDVRLLRRGGDSRT